MPMKLEPGTRYDMPASFGPSIVPQRTIIEHAEVLVLTTTTDQAAVERLVPAHFTVPPTPPLTVSYIRYPDVDYLGGRSYREIVVSVGAHFEGADGVIEAALALVLWVDQPGALIAGREYMGFPKLMGRITATNDSLRFDCAEYDHAVLEGGAHGLRPVPQDRLPALNARAGEVRTFGWRYVAGPPGSADLDQPLVNVMRWNYRQAWTGQGDFRFLPVAFVDAPMSANAVRALAALPHRSPVRAFRGLGRATIDRTATHVPSRSG